MLEDYDEAQGSNGPGGAEGRGNSFLSVLPGGIAPEPEETAVAGIILVALAVVILVRKGFGSVLNK